MNTLNDQVGLYQDRNNLSSFRKYLNITVLTAGLYFLSGCGGCNSKDKAYVARVIDGDTIVLSTGEHIRLIGENTPEKKEFGFKEAKKRLEELVLNKEVELESEKRDKDKYGRLLRDVYVNGTFVNEVMIEEGYAELMFFSPDNKYESVLTEARDRHLATHSKGKCPRAH